MVVGLGDRCYASLSGLTFAYRYGAEVLPMTLRSKVMGLAAASHFIVNVGITEAGPTAFANIKEVRTRTIDNSMPGTDLYTELLLRLRRMRSILPGHRIFLFPVSHILHQPLPCNHSRYRFSACSRQCC
jgi:hypothetical protein